MADSSPSIVTSNSDMNSQNAFMAAMLANMKPEQAAPIQQALALAARKRANYDYVCMSPRKVAPALTNGSTTQAYALSTPMTFNMPTALNGYLEGLIIRYNVSYTLATGTSAVYGLTAAGSLGFIDTVEVRYNKSQHKFRPQVLRQLALLGAMDDWTLPSGILVGQHQTALDSYLNSAAGVSTGANSVTQEFFVPFNLVAPEDPRGWLPLMAGDTGIQVIVNTPVSLLGSDAVLNSIYPVSGTGHAMSAISGTMEVMAVYRDGDDYTSTNKMPFDISLLDGTFQMQIDQTLSPLVANTVQRTKLNVMGKHYYVVLLVVDGNQSNLYSANSNISYMESAKDGIGGNVFWKYGSQTNLSVNEFLYLQRLGGRQDVDQGVIPMINGPVNKEGSDWIRHDKSKVYLDNTRTGWSDWRYGVQVATTGAQGSGPRIEPHVFYINPTGLVPV